MKQPRRLRRCQLAVPGSSDKMMAKAAAMDVDHVFLDLEDAVAPGAKVPARGQIVNAVWQLTVPHLVASSCSRWVNSLLHGAGTGDDAKWAWRALLSWGERTG